MKRFEILMIFFYKCISIKVTEQIVNPIIVFAANNFKVLKNERKKDRENYELTYVVIIINIYNTTIFEPVF